MNGLTGRTALITGGSRGIGAAICVRLAREGASVAVNYSRSAEAAEQVVARIRDEGGTAYAVRADLGDPDQIHGLFAEVLARSGRLDILINNAAVAERGDLLAMDREHYERQFAVNVRGLLFATQEAARAFGTGGGRIVNITSGAAQAAPASMSVYSATKAAAETLTRSHAAELGSKNITVNAVSPGVTETDMMQSMIVAPFRDLIVQNTALGRLGTPEDIADVVAFLVSDDARWITGAVIPANGGLR